MLVSYRCVLLPFAICYLLFSILLFLSKLLNRVVLVINWETVREHRYLIWAIPIRKPWLSSGGFLKSFVLLVFSFLFFLLFA